MGIVEEVLADFETPDGQNYTVEYNSGGNVHIHTDHVRIVLTEAEFLEFAEVIVDGRDELIHLKDDI